MKNFVSFNQLWFPERHIPCQYIRIWRWIKNSMKIRNFGTICRIFCQNHTRRIFYGSRDFEIFHLWNILYLTMSYGFRKVPFPANIYAFEDESKMAWKYAIFGQSSEYSAKIMLVEYYTGLEISKFEFFGWFWIWQQLTIFQ